MRQSGALKQKECSNERNLLAWFLSTRLTGASFRLKSRKGNGTIACREKVCSRTVAMKADDQDKVRMSEQVHGTRCCLPRFSVRLLLGTLQSV